jgi:hypothetical protein
MSSREQIAFWFVAGSLVLGCLFGIATLGMTRAERAECIRWQADAANYPAWYSTAWQKEQCKQFDIHFVK